MIRIWFNRKKKYSKEDKSVGTIQASTGTRSIDGYGSKPPGMDVVEQLAVPKVNLDRINLYSRALANPDIIYTIVMNLQDTRLFKLEIDSRSSAVERLLSQVKVPATGSYYLYATSNGTAIRMLVAGGRMIAITLEEGPRVYYGVEALEEMGNARGVYNASLSRINTVVANWSPEYSVGINVLDTQHREFFKTINSIFESIVSGLFHEKGDNIMKGLLGYTRGHFKSEEAIMEKYSYPGIEDHRKHHRIFTRAVISFYDEYSKEPDNMDLAARVFVITRDWLRDHILSVDKRYEEYFNRLGVKVEDTH